MNEGEKRKKKLKIGRLSAVTHTNAIYQRSDGKIKFGIQFVACTAMSSFSSGKSKIQKSISIKTESFSESIAIDKSLKALIIGKSIQQLEAS